MHPECFHYAITASPMRAGRMDHYRSTGHDSAFAGTAVVLGDSQGNRAGTPAEPWHAVWASGYLVITDPITELPAALLRPGDIVRMRPIPAGG